MEQVMALLQTVVPILVCIGLGFLARKKELLTPEQTGGIQQFVLKFCIPPGCCSTPVWKRSSVHRASPPWPCFCRYCC